MKLQNKQTILIEVGILTKDGKHYDSDVPYGVENFYYLPVFKIHTNK